MTTNSNVIPETIRRHAEKFTHLGFSLFWCRQDKTPVGRWQGTHTQGVDVLYQTYRPGYTLAGSPPPGVFVLDIDGEEGKQTLARLVEELGPLPETLTHSTQSGGLHLFFHCESARQFQNRKDLPKLDTRVGGVGYVVLPPSEGLRGSYRIEKDLPLATLPPHWEKRLFGDLRKPGRSPRGDTTIPEAILKHWTEGQRDILAMAVAGIMFKDGVTEKRALQLLRQICEEAGDDEVATRLQKARAWNMMPGDVAGTSIVFELLDEAEAAEFISAVRSLYRPPWWGCLTRRRRNARGEWVDAPPYRGIQAVRRLAQYGGLDNISLIIQESGAIEWYFWNGTAWVATAVTAIAQDYLRPIISDGLEDKHPEPRMVADLIDGLRNAYLSGTLPTEPPKDRTGQVMVFQNGYLELDTMELKPHSKEQGFAPLLDMDYDPAAECPHIDALLHRLGPTKEYYNLLTAWLWQVIRGKNDAQVILHLRGEGGTGKTTFSELASSLLHKDYVTAGRLEHIRGRFETHKFFGKRLIVFGDPDKYVSEVGVLKQLAGGDLLTGEPKGQQPIDFVYQGNILITSNHAVAPRTHDSGWDRRYRLVRCDNKIPLNEQRDDYFENVLKPELPGLINKLLARFRGQGRSHIQLLKKPEDHIDTYMGELVEERETNDPLFAFVSQCLIVDDSLTKDDYISLGTSNADKFDPMQANIESTELYPKYLAFRKLQGHNGTPSCGTFTRELQQVLKAMGWKGKKLRVRTKGKKGPFDRKLTHLRWSPQADLKALCSNDHREPTEEEEELKKHLEDGNNVH